MHGRIDDKVFFNLTSARSKPNDFVFQESHKPVLGIARRSDRGLQYPDW